MTKAFRAVWGVLSMTKLNGESSHQGIPVDELNRVVGNHHPKDDCPFHLHVKVALLCADTNRNKIIETAEALDLRREADLILRNSSRAGSVEKIRVKLAILQAAEVVWSAFEDGAPQGIHSHEDLG